MTDYIEVLKLGKLSLQKNINNIGKESYEINRVDIIDDKENYERDHIGERK